MVEFTRTILQPEVNTYYLNLTDEQGKTHGAKFPANRLPIAVLDGEARVSFTRKQHSNQLWGGLSDWFSMNAVFAGTRVLIRHDPAERYEGHPVVHLIPRPSESPRIHKVRHHDRVPWTSWVGVGGWLDGGKDAGPKPPDDYGVYRFQVRQAHPKYAGTLLYIGSTQKSGKPGKGVDNFTGLRRRIWQFVSSALGFGMETNPGGRIYEYGVSASDLEASWAVVVCPKCAEHEEYFRANPSPLLNRNTPPRCNRNDCPW